MDKLTKTVKAIWPLLLILFISGFLFTFTLNRDLLTDWDECVYAQQAIEMKQTGNFITNHWNGADVFEKPPLNNWLMQPMYLFGVNEFTGRFTMVLLGLSLLVLVYLFAYRYFSTTIAILSTLLLLASELIVVYTSRVNTDIGFTLFAFAGFFAWIESYKKSKYAYLAGVFFGLAVLNKGLSITPFLLALALTLLFDFKKQYLYNFIKMTIVFVAVITPWHLYQLFTYGNAFFQVYIIEHIIKRARNPIDYHFEGRLFYFRLIFSNFKPWIIFTPVIPLFYLFKIRNLMRLKKIAHELRDSRLLFTIAALIIIPLFSITQVKTRIAWYAMPIYPFIALFIALSISALFNKLRIQKFIIVVIVLISLDAFKTISTELHTLNNQFSVDPRYAVFIASQKYPQDTIHYLVQYSERRAEEVLAEPYRTSTTFVYGGNPCAVYYSKKRIAYYYSVEKFEKRLKEGKGLFVIENGDEKIVGNLRIRRLHENKNFILFER